MLSLWGCGPTEDSGHPAQLTRGVHSPALLPRPAAEGVILPARTVKMIPASSVSRAKTDLPTTERSGIARSKKFGGCRARLGPMVTTRSSFLFEHR